MKTVRARKAFTLLELVLVIAIISVVATVLIPTFTSLIRRAERLSVLNNLDKMNKAILNASILSGKPLTADDIRRILSEAGFDGILRNGKDKYIYCLNKLDDTVVAWDVREEKIICSACSAEKYSQLDISKFGDLTALSGTENDKTETDGKTEIKTEKAEVESESESESESKIEIESIASIDSATEAPTDYTEPEQTTDPDGMHYIEIPSDKSDKSEDKNTAKALLNAIQGAKEGAFFIKLSDSATVSITDISEFNEALKPSKGGSKDITVDLNKGTIEWTDESKGICLSSNCSLTLMNGTVKFTSSKEDDNTSAISVEAGAILTLNNVTLNSINGACVAASNTAKAKIEGCTLKGSSYGICVKKGAGKGTADISIAQTYIEAAVAVFCGTAATVNISDSSILNGKRNALIVRVGNITINDSTLKIGTLPAKPYLYANFVLGFEEGYWQSGSTVPAAVLTLGDYSEDDAAYTGEVDIELTNVTLKTPNASKVPKILLAAHSEDKTVTLTYDDSYSCEIDQDDLVVYGADLDDISAEHFGTMTVNGEEVVYDE